VICTESLEEYTSLPTVYYSLRKGMKNGEELERKSDFLNQEFVFGCHLQRLRTRVYPKFSGLAAWSEDCKWYSSLPLSAVVSLFCESV
jgi:hypothetical protein